ncbi:hypothetical protein B6N60_01199 [Richelia sinica FACHB-800]|uniref:Uncharacterized protein n=1 Tax=Richelia sinica FACHB-800 TaxID=1357546 RepID=A0A975Y3V2_9NOST|nr:hypothetical protein B6N60_01199 [Richelia sinica FACHB-800]
MDVNSTACWVVGGWFLESGVAPLLARVHAIIVVSYL